MYLYDKLKYAVKGDSDAYAEMYDEWRGLLWSAGNRYTSLLERDEIQSVLDLAFYEWLCAVDPDQPLEQQLSLLRVDEALEAEARGRQPIKVPRTTERRYRRMADGISPETRAQLDAISQGGQQVERLDQQAEDDLEAVLDRDLAEFALTQMTRDEQETWRAKCRFSEFEDCFDRVDQDPTDAEIAEFFGLSRLTITRLRAAGLTRARAGLALI